MGSGNNRALSNRTGGPLRRPLRCQRRTITIPRSFELLESEVVLWMSGCVQSRTETSRGLPAYRENFLVPESNLQELWDTVLHVWIGHQITLYVSYQADAETLHTNRLIFSAPRVRRAVVSDEEPSITEINPSLPNRVPIPEPHFDSTRPSIVDIGKSLKQLVDAARGLPISPWFWLNGIKETLTRNYRNLREGDEVIDFQGKVIGFCDTLARMASDLPNNPLLYFDRPLRPLPLFPETNIDWEMTTQLQNAYRRGYRMADEFLSENFEQLRAVDERGNSLPWYSTYFLFNLKRTFGNSREEIYRGLKAQFPPTNRIPSEYRTN